MDYLILIIVLAILGVSAFLGYKKGMIKILLSMVALIVTFILAAMLTVPVSGVVKAVTPLDEGIEQSVSDLISKNEIVNAESIKQLNLPGQIEKALVEGAETAVDGFNQHIVSALTDMLVKAVTFFVLIIIIYVAVSIVINVLDFISKLPIINTFNKGGGLLLGLAKGLMYVWVAFLIVTASANEPWAQETLAQINGNSLLTFLYNNNLITLFIASLI